MSLQGKSEEEIRALETALLAKVQELGGSAGNTALQRALDWAEEDYWPIRDRLVDLGSLRRYRARGGAVAFVPPPQPVVERTFGWLNHSRRLSKSYERLTRTDEAWIYIAMTRIMLERLA